MRRSSAVRELWAGILLTVAFVVFFVLLISVGEQNNLLAPKVTFHARFNQTEGLSVGAPVRLEGVPVGSVTEIGFPEDPDDFSVVVTFHVERSAASRIRENTKAVLISQGLIGEMVLGLKRGTRASPPAEPGSFLEARETGTLEEFKSQGQVIAENIISISGDIRAILQRIEQGEGLLARVLTDEEFARSFLERLDRTSQSLEEITVKLNNGDSFLGRLLAADDPQATGAAGSVFELVDRLEALVARLEGGEGILGRLLAEDEKMKAMLSQMSETVASLRSITREIEEGEGLMARMVHDEEMARQLLEDLQATSENIAAVTEKLEQGEGTLGALLADPTVYEGLRDLVGGIQKSRVLRWFVHRKVKKGAEADLETAPPESGSRPRVRDVGPTPPEDSWDPERGVRRRPRGKR